MLISSHANVRLVSYDRPGCTKLFTIKMGKRAANAIYRRTRKVTKHELHLLGRIEMCQRQPSAQRYIRWYDRHQSALHKQRIKAASFTGYIVAGKVSTFGPPPEGTSGTADGGSDARPCIALKDTSTLGRLFLVTILGHRAVLLHCDSGPYAGGRQIDVTGEGAYSLGFNPYNFPTDSWGTAQELR